VLDTIGTYQTLFRYLIDPLNIMVEILHRGGAFIFKFSPEGWGGEKSKNKRAQPM
jgi:hypothetical protein